MIFPKETRKRSAVADWKSVTRHVLCLKGGERKCTLRFDCFAHCTRSQRNIYFHRWPTLRRILWVMRCHKFIISWKTQLTGGGGGSSKGGEGGQKLQQACVNSLAWCSKKWFFFFLKLLHRHKRRDTTHWWKSERRRAACTGGVHVLPQPVAATRHSGGNSCSSAPNRMFLTHENLLSESLSVTMLVAGRRPQSWVCGVGASWWKNKVFVSSLWMFLRIFVVAVAGEAKVALSGEAVSAVLHCIEVS